MTRNNVVLIHCDALAYSMLGITGNRLIRTPHIDALAREGGVLFDGAYTCSGVCVPSRASLATGRYPIAHGVVNNNITLSPAEEGMGRLFSRAGYATGYFGKTHFARPDSDMAAEGWREAFLWNEHYNGYLKERGIRVRYPEKKVARKLLKYWPVGRSAIPAEHYQEKVVADKAIEFIRSHRREDFLCFVGNVAPHGPFTPPAPYDQMYAPRDMDLSPRPDGELDGKPAAMLRWVRQNQKYITPDELRIYLAAIYGLITLVDEGVGRIVAALREENLYDRTLIVFTSDHGDFASRYGIIGKSWSSIEELMHVPLIISAPGCRANARRTAALTDNVDILPTLMEFAAVQPSPKIQGVSLGPLLRGEKDSAKAAAFAYTQFEYSGGLMAQSMVREGRWKLLQTQDGFSELYDLAADPMEVHNIAGKDGHAGEVAALRQRLLNWHIGCSGVRFNEARAAFWEDETCFYDERRFCGERLLARGDPP